VFFVDFLHDTSTLLCFNCELHAGFLYFHFSDFWRSSSLCFQSSLSFSVPSVGYFYEFLLIIMVLRFSAFQSGLRVPLFAVSQSQGIANYRLLWVHCLVDGGVQLSWPKVVRLLAASQGSQHTTLSWDAARSRQLYPTTYKPVYSQQPDTIRLWYYKERNPQAWLENRESQHHNNQQKFIKITNTRYAEWQWRLKT
jgi:hypothetical protein